MRASVVTVIVLTACQMSVLDLEAGSLEKAYFGATPPGAWAKCESSWEMANGMAGTNEYTYVRASDSEGRVRIEITTRVLAGPGEGSTTRQLFVMEQGFDLARDFIDYMSSLEASATQAGEGLATLIPANVIEIMRSSAGDLTSSLTFKGPTKIGGHTCDRYIYSYSSSGPNVTKHEGEICLDEAVPFGVVHRKERATDQDGAPVSSFEQKLLETGTGESASDVLLAMTPSSASAPSAAAAPGAAASVPFVEAYTKGVIRLLVEVLERTGGRRLEIAVVNQAEGPIDLVVPGAPVTIPVGSPVGELNLVFSGEQTIHLDPGAGSPPLPAGQPGNRGIVGGRFQLTVYEGTPIYQGSVEIGPLE